MIFRNIDHRGRKFDRFHVRAASYGDFCGRSWVIYGRNPEYGDTLVALCGWRGERGGRRFGWVSKRDAEAALAAFLAEREAA